MKVTVVGAGAVGASCAEYIAIKDFADEIVLIDIKEGFAEGKAMDLMQTASLNGFDSTITGTTNDYSKTANSDVAVITSGIPRKPGMTREELIDINAGIVKTVAENLIKYSPNVILIVVSNPMDTMAYLAHKATGLPKNRIIGMGGALDSARFKFRLAEALGCPQSDVDGIVIGGHSDTGMVPLIEKAVRNSVPVSEFLSEEKMAEVVEATKVGGATLTKLLGTSAWYAPGAAVSELVKAIALDSKKLFPCSALLEGEYGLTDISLGVPCILGKNGIESIVEIALSDAEKEKLVASAAGVREVNNLLTV
ncbi:MAG TPA: malate dehydrogenase [Prolixibacteraceae bacterium]|jgi:malate dehydrogenase|nr:malate dehydrogenase [Bacteroidales bacterium]HNZ72075.1 malate dehydrogenase [Prolixibacteraceae bacterium]HPB04858.1 malate dehydrogenase [Prolixibacteraceae bacterium]HQN93369.1 malate dehydrogenase [Prolixibacteraceae bacterium]HUM89564.1 malate dehydrogenase [Prolixibacteraceae bacterium]